MRKGATYPHVVLLAHTPLDEFGRQDFTLVCPDPAREGAMLPDPGPFRMQCFVADPQVYVRQYAAEGQRVLVLDDPSPPRRAPEAVRLLAPALAAARRALRARRARRPEKPKFKPIKVLRDMGGPPRAH